MNSTAIEPDLALFPSVIDWYRTKSEPHWTQGDFKAALCDPGDIHWLGGISQIKRVDGEKVYIPKPGTFWMPNRLDPVKAPKSGSTDWKIGRGIGKDTILDMPMVFAEMDDGSIPEQLARLVAAVAAGLPVPTAVILSGDGRYSGLIRGKSVHVFWRLDLPFKKNEADAWKAVQKSLMSVMGGDPTICDLPRRMRWGGVASTQAGPFDDNDEVAPRMQSILWIGDRVARDVVETWASGIATPTGSEASLSADSSPGSSGGSITEMTFTSADSQVHGHRTSLSKEEKKKGRGVTRRQHLPFSTTLTSDGTTLASIAAVLMPGGKEPCHCPNPKHQDSTASAFVAMTTGGELFVHCSSTHCQQTWWDSDQGVSSWGLPAGTAAEESSSDSEETSSVTTTTYTSRDLILGRYMPDHKVTAPVTLVRAPKGAGKTQWLKAKVAEHRRLHPDIPVINVVHRRSLAGELSMRLEIPDYRKLKGDIETSASVCLDSIRRVSTIAIDDPDGVGIGLVGTASYLVIIDESEQVLRHLFAGTMSGGDSLDAHTRLRTILGNAHRVICCDADMSKLTLDEMRSIRGEDEEIEVVDVELYQEWAYGWTTDRVAHTKLMMDRWKEGKRLSIPMMANADAATMAAMLRKARPGAKVGLITSDTSKTVEIKTALSDLDVYAKSCDALIYSPTLGTGVSIDVRNHFDHIMPILYSGVGTAQDAMQLAHRVRHPKSPQIDCWVSPTGTWSERRPDRIASSLLSLAERTRRGKGAGRKTQAYALGRITADADGLARLTPTDRDHFGLYVQVLSHERSCGGRGGHLLSALHGYWRTQQLYATPRHLDDELEALAPEERAEVTTARKEAREATAEARAKRIIAAPVITIEEARNVNEPISQRESDSVELAHIKDVLRRAASGHGVGQGGPQVQGTAPCPGPHLCGRHSSPGRSQGRRD